MITVVSADVAESAILARDKYVVLRNDAEAKFADIDTELVELQAYQDKVSDGMKQIIPTIVDGKCEELAGKLDRRIRAETVRGFETLRTFRDAIREQNMRIDAAFRVSLQNAP